MFNPERQNRFGSKFEVTMPDFPTLKIQPKFIRIHQKRGHHDVVELFYERFSPFLMSGLKTGVPVKISWQNDKAKGKFFGYTSDASHVSEQTIKRGVKVTCVSSSFVLKEKKSKVWKNKTSSEIIFDICKSFKLKAVVTPTTIKYTQQSLAGITYWEKIRELADREGYGFHVTETELHFHPIDTMIDKFMTVTPVMSFIDPFLNVSSEFEGQTLDSFTPIIGDFVQGEGHNRTNKTVSGVDPVTGKPLTHKAMPNKSGKQLRKNTKEALFESQETSVVVGSQQMAKAMASGKASLSRLSIPATGVGQGDPRISPWRSIEVRGVDEVSNGYWVVDSVMHFIHIDGRYQCEFSCVTDGTGSNKPSNTRPSKAGSSPVRNIAADIAGTQKKPTVTKLSATSPMIKQSSVGFKVTPRKWVGR
jgi:phage protein D